MGNLRRLIRSLANGYRNSRFGTDYRPASRLGKIAAIFVPGMRERLDKQFRCLPRSAGERRVLDVGFGSGEFLELAHDAGWSVVGVDTDPVSVKSARLRDFDVHTGGVEALDEMQESFDAITLSHVIEHVHDPLGQLKKIYSLLKPGGTLWLETPNIQSRGHRAFGQNWLHLDPPRHLSLFSWHSLLSILKQAGFHRVTPLVAYFDYIDSLPACKALAREDRFDRGGLCRKDVLPILMHAAMIRIDRRNSEFITVIASKPLTADMASQF